MLINFLDNPCRIAKRRTIYIAEKLCLYHKVSRLRGAEMGRGIVDCNVCLPERHILLRAQTPHSLLTLPQAGTPRI